jgi:hypothetical protein
VKRSGSRLVIEVFVADLFSQVAVAGETASLKVTLNVCKLAINIALPVLQFKPIVGSPARCPNVEGGMKLS